MMGLHQENEARLKVFMKVQINLVELTEFWGSVGFSVGTAELEPEFPQESHQESKCITWFHLRNSDRLKPHTHASFHVASGT
jgi:hypothetical protein